MKNSVIFGLASVALVGCGSSDVVSKLGSYQGNTLKVVWSPTSDKHASVMVHDKAKDSLPDGAEANTAAFAKFFYATTGCTVDNSVPVKAYISDGKPLFLVVPKNCG